jgi:phosphoribosylaminoimidazole-succinocarboxamide synthase
VKQDYIILEKYTRALFQRGTEIAAASRGLIFRHTKFGKLRKEGKIVLIDEIYTPDSSRYFYCRRLLREARQRRKQHRKNLSVAG